MANQLIWSTLLSNARANDRDREYSDEPPAIVKFLNHLHSILMRPIRIFDVPVQIPKDEIRRRLALLENDINECICERENPLTELFRWMEIPMEIEFRKTLHSALKEVLFQVEDLEKRDKLVNEYRIEIGNNIKLYSTVLQYRHNAIVKNKYPKELMENFEITQKEVLSENENMIDIFLYGCTLEHQALGEEEPKLTWSQPSIHFEAGKPEPGHQLVNKPILNTRKCVETCQGCVVARESKFKILKDALPEYNFELK